MDCKKAENLKSCPCTWPNCPRKGICCECLRHHREKGELPACYFSKDAEATYDRSTKSFIKNQRNNFIPSLTVISSRLKFF